jgi:hypothetical protein
MKMWIWRKMNKTSSVKRKTNEQVLKDVREKRDIMRHKLIRKTKLIGLLFRHNSFVTNIFEGKIKWTLKNVMFSKPQISHGRHILYTAEKRVK